MVFGKVFSSPGLNPCCNGIYLIIKQGNGKINTLEMS